MAKHGSAKIVEVDSAGLVWIKSSSSSGTPNTCVEIAWTPGLVHVRSSKNRLVTRLIMPVEVWRSFVDSL